MNPVQVEQKSYQMPPQDGSTVAHFLTVADIEGSARRPRFSQQIYELHIAVPSASEAGERARHMHHGSVVSDGRAWQTRMLNGKVGYYADFVIYGMLVVALVS